MAVAGNDHRCPGSARCAIFCSPAAGRRAKASGMHGIKPAAAGRLLRHPAALRKFGILNPWPLLLVIASVVRAAGVTGEEAGPGTVFGVAGSRFTLNGTPTFLLGFSYYGALGASGDFVRRDLDDFSRRGFNWLRVWATWSAFDADVSAVDGAGRGREPYLGRLRALVAECDQRGLIVDVTLTRGRAGEAGRLGDFAAHRRAVETLVTALGPHRNWYLDLANERDVRDARFVPATELRRLRDRARELDPGLLVTASFGGHDLAAVDLHEAVIEIGVDFLSPHRPRHAGSPAETEGATRKVRAALESLGRMVPVHHQEPFRRGYTDWEPITADFLTDLRGAVKGGAAGWCFHNGSERGAPEQRPRRSFDLREVRLWEQLDAEERGLVRGAAALVR